MPPFHLVLIPYLRESNTIWLKSFITLPTTFCLLKTAILYVSCIWLYLAIYYFSVFNSFHHFWVICYRITDRILFPTSISHSTIFFLVFGSHFPPFFIAYLASPPLYCPFFLTNHLLLSPSTIFFTSLLHFPIVLVVVVASHLSSNFSNLVF